MSETNHPAPETPSGFAVCRAYKQGVETTHLVALDENGSNGGRPTVCGLTRLDDRDEAGRDIPNSADLSEWGMSGGSVVGPGVTYVFCKGCYSQAGPTTEVNAPGEER